MTLSPPHLLPVDEVCPKLLRFLLVFVDLFEGGDPLINGQSGLLLRVNELLEEILGFGLLGILVLGLVLDVLVLAEHRLWVVFVGTREVQSGLKGNTLLCEAVLVPGGVRVDFERVLAQVVDQELPFLLIGPLYEIVVQYLQLLLFPLPLQFLLLFRKHHRLHQRHIHH